MKKTIQILLLSLLLFTGGSMRAQLKPVGEDASLKDEIYKKHKKEVQAYDKKDFDALFLEFFQKQRDRSVTLTKDEFYTYTIKIALYSEKLGLLYKDQKESSQKAKQEWFNKSYSEYLNSKK
jgi:hypothetical protein